MHIQATYLANLFEYASFKGISEKSLRDFLSDKNLDVCYQNNSVTRNEYIKIFEYLLETTSDKNFGIHYGCYLNLKALGFVVQLSLNSSSIEQAVYIVQQYLQTTFPLVQLESEKRNEEYILELTSTIENENIRSQVLDFVYCFLFRELKLMIPEAFIPTMEVDNSNLAEFAHFLNVEIRKGEKYIFRFEASVLGMEINKKRTKEIELLLPKFLQMLDKKKEGYKVFSMQIRNMILNMCCPELPNFEQVAMQFSISNRTLQRKLTEEGFSFRKITDDVKKELSSYLSKDNTIKTQDIAYILGYSGPSAYLHAVKKWKNII